MLVKHNFVLTIFYAPPEVTLIPSAMTVASCFLLRSARSRSDAILFAMTVASLRSQ